MPTLFTHGLIGVTAAQVWRPAGVPRRLVLWSMTLAVLPDIDGIPYLLGLLPNFHSLGHRGALHSLAAAVVFGALATASMLRGAPARGVWVRYWIFFTLVTASHGLLDMATNGGSGIALLAPFSDERLFWPIRSISVSPIRPARWLTAFGARAVVSEVATLWTLCGAVVIMARVGRLDAAAPAPLRWVASAALVATALVAWIVLAFQQRLPA